MFACDRGPCHLIASSRPFLVYHRGSSQHVLKETEQLYNVLFDKRTPVATWTA